MQKEVIDYKVIRRSSIEGLRDAVMGNIEQGWTISGGVAVGKVAFYQAIVKYKEKS